MKRLSFLSVSLMTLLFFLSPFESAFAIKKASHSSSKKSTPRVSSTALTLDKDASFLIFNGKKLKFKSGEFGVKKGTLSSGKLAIDLQPFFEDDITFTLKEFTETPTFAPGSPNAQVRGDLHVQGKVYPVETGVFYTPNENGFEAKSVVQNGQFKVEGLIVAKRTGVKNTVPRK